MSDQQLEAAARHYCRLTEQDPNQLVGHSAKPDAQGYVPAVCIHSPRWMVVREHLRSQALVNEALEWGRTQT